MDGGWGVGAAGNDGGLIFIRPYKPRRPDLTPILSLTLNLYLCLNLSLAGGFSSARTSHGART